ncbi:MAG TPA: 4Fe-4S ferredoxin [Spirochaetia bacterium]|nr:MAG: hypothetical protein A2Y41_08630 [Spirochaetes bacterium GWB1_36_13]HCL56311.1 4Fe-4S ferredoxin [Spirochaetia bacterium]
MNKVFFTDMHAFYGNSIETKFEKLLIQSGMKDLIKKGELVAIKVHVGERGNLGYVNHNYARITAELVRQAGGKPFFTDTNTLYSGGRHNAVDHSETAILHGYSYTTTRTPFIAADGLRGLNYKEIEINQKHIKKAKIASGILEADKIIFLTHFKGHMEAGFGGAIKNMAMGCSSIAGKLEQHSSSKPNANPEKCVGCRQCFRVCRAGAISMKDNKAVIDKTVCIGCGQCVAACNYSSILPAFNEHHEVFLEKLAEYAFAVHQVFQDKSFYINFAVNITPDCDCWPANDTPIVNDVGIFASSNFLALDRATLDKVNLSRPNPNSSFSDKIKNQKNIFQEIRPEIPVDYTLSCLKKLGLNDAYELIKIQ